MYGHKVKTTSLISTWSDLVNPNCSKFSHHACTWTLAMTLAMDPLLCDQRWGLYVLSSRVHAWLDWNLEVRPKPERSFPYSQKIFEGFTCWLGFILWLIKRHGWHSQTCEGKQTLAMLRGQIKNSPAWTLTMAAASTRSGCHFACDEMSRTVAGGNVHPKVSTIHPHHPVRSFTIPGFF